MLKRSHIHPWMVILAILASVSFMAPSGTAQSSPAPPQIGSPNTVMADPLVSRPRTQPCVVQLFTNVRFADFSPKSFSCAPPADCPLAGSLIARPISGSAGRTSTSARPRSHRAE